MSKQTPRDDIYSTDYWPPGYREKDDFIELAPYNPNWPSMAQTEILNKILNCDRYVKR